MKTIISIITILILAYFGGLIFNHINAWAGIAFEITLVLLIVKYYNKIFK